MKNMRCGVNQCLICGKKVKATIFSDLICFDCKMKLGEGDG